MRTVSCSSCKEEFHTNRKNQHLCGKELCRSRHYGKNRKVKYGESGTREANWKYDLKNKYGLTPSDYDELVVRAESKCQICQDDLEFDTSGGNLRPVRGRIHSKTPCVDHDHSTGEVRGILCANCNRGIGFLQDSVEVLDKAKQYLNKGA